MLGPLECTTVPVEDDCLVEGFEDEVELEDTPVSTPLMPTGIGTSPTEPVASHLPSPS